MVVHDHTVTSANSLAVFLHLFKHVAQVPLRRLDVTIYASQVPQTYRTICRARCAKMCFYLQRLDRACMPAQATDLLTSEKVPNA